MSETRIWITAVFNDPHQAERYADCLGALQQADQSRHAQLNRELGLKPLLAGELEDVPVDSLALFGAGVEVWLPRAARTVAVSCVSDGQEAPRQPLQQPIIYPEAFCLLLVESA